MTAPSTAKPVAARLLVPVLVFVGLVVAVVGSLGAPLVPTVARVTHTSLTAAQWSLTIVLLVGAVATPVMGRLGDGPRRREVILAAIAVVAAGCVLSALPLDFVWLLTGRALQGVGFGLIPLAMATAREALPADRARSAIGLLSVTSIAGIGIGYPLAGLATEAWGLRSAFWAGAVVTVIALAGAAWVLPPAAAREPRDLDLAGALLLGAALTAILLVIAQGSSWGWTGPRILGLAVIGLVTMTIWVRHELRVEHPLVDLRLLANRAVLTADVTTLFGGIGMYLLLTLVARYVQTPASAGYGLDESVIVAGAVLVPFSAASFLASRTTPPLIDRLTATRTLATGFAIVVAAIATFLLWRNTLPQILTTMAVAGFGVGTVFAANPSLIISGVPPTETGSALSLNQVLRSIGFSVGSATTTAVLAAATPPGAALPHAWGYPTAALIAASLSAVTVGISLLLPGRAASR